MSLGERIRIARAAKGLTQKQIADHFGIKRVSVTQWESGDSRPDSDKMGDLAHFLGASLSWLMTGEGQGPVQPDGAITSKGPKSKGDTFRPTPIPGTDLVGATDFPIYGAAQGGAAGHLIIDFNPIQHVKRPAILEGVRDAYGIRVDGESMVPAFRAGDIALIHPHLLPEADTDVVLFDHDPKTGDAEALIKHLTGMTDKLWKLEQYNPAKKFSEHRADWPICHRVVGRYDRRR